MQNKRLWGIPLGDMKSLLEVKDRPLYQYELALQHLLTRFKLVVDI